MNRLRELRGKRTQKVVAEQLNIVQNTLSNYETGIREMDYEMLFKVADYYNVSIDYILGRNCSKFTTYEISDEAYKAAMAYDALGETQKSLIDGYITALADSSPKEIKDKVLSILHK